MKRLILLFLCLSIVGACSGESTPRDGLLGTYTVPPTTCPSSTNTTPVDRPPPTTNPACPAPKAAPHFGGSIPDVRGCPPMTETDPSKLDPNSPCSSPFNNPAIPCEVRGNCDVVPPRYCSQNPTQPCAPDTTTRASPATLQQDKLLAGVDAITALGTGGVCKFVVYTSLSEADFRRVLMPTVLKVLGSSNRCAPEMTISNDQNVLWQRGCNEADRNDPKIGVISFEGCPRG